MLDLTGIPFSSLIMIVTALPLALIQPWPQDIARRGGLKPSHQLAWQRQG
jgi:hypothetical protein